ncbi:ribokinase [Alkaliphilus crotonatoxidans]
MKQIAVIGSLNMDLVVKVRKMPKLGETIFGNQYKEIPGGKGANQALAIARLGGNIHMIGRVGADSFGTILLENLARDGVNLEAVKKTPQVATGIAMIIVEEEGNNSIVVVPGANFSLTVEGLKEKEAMEKLAEADILLAQLEVPLSTVAFGLQRAKEMNKTTILNPAPAVDLDEEIFKNVDLLLPNETELERLSGIAADSKENLIKGAKVLLDKGVKEMIVTLGEKGCLYVSKDLIKEYQAYPVKAVDTTAAGDSFAAAVAVALAEGRSLDETIDFAMQVGALTVMKEGAQSSLPYRSDLAHFKGGIK